MFIITGGGSGIGRALAHALAKRNKSVLIIGRRESALIETTSSRVCEGSPALIPNDIAGDPSQTRDDVSQFNYVCADVALSEGRQRVLEYLEKEPVIEGLIHNAGVIDPILPITAIDEVGWRQVMATNVEAPLFLSQLLYNKLVNGRVLHIGSAAAYFPVEGWAAYCTSKAALSMLTRCWQLESDSVAFASVMPGIIDTDMQAQIRNASHMNVEKADFFKQLHQDKQLVSPATVAEFLCWLLLDIDAAQYVSKEWDIYDQTHHHAWLVPPHSVPPLE